MNQETHRVMKRVHESMDKCGRKHEAYESCEHG